MRHLEPGLVEGGEQEARVAVAKVELAARSVGKELMRRDSLRSCSLLLITGNKVLPGIAIS